ncbi:MAG: hypothetical protein ACRDN7_08885, partial [Rubrobacter sp.]
MPAPPLRASADLASKLTPEGAARKDPSPGATTFTLAPAVSAHEGHEASSGHFPGLDRDAPWMSRALVIGGLAVLGIYATQRRWGPNPSVGIARMKAKG